MSGNKLALKTEVNDTGLEHEDRRITRTKKALREALISLIEEKGFEALTVNDLCVHADINRGTFYNHYHDKEELLRTTQDEMIDGLVSTFQSEARKLRVKDLTLLKLKRKPLPLLVDLFDCLRAEGDFLHAMMGSGGDICFGPRMQEVVGDILITSILNPQYRENPTPFVNYYVAYFTSAYLGIIAHWLAGGMKESSEEMALIAARLFFIKPGESIKL